MINKLFGKNIIIIGGSGLIGKSITNLLLSRITQFTKFR